MKSLDRGLEKLCGVHKLAAEANTISYSEKE